MTHGSFSASRREFILLLGLASTLPYLAALGLNDLRQNTTGFEVAFFAAFGLYLAAVALVLRAPPAGRRDAGGTLAVVFVFAVLFRVILLPTRPALSDDMYRYVWDGRVQAQAISPYKYPADAGELSYLRHSDDQVWKYINRKPHVTVYPPGAQVAFAGIWRAVGDRVTGFKAIFVIGELAGGLLLMGVLRALGQPAERVLIYLWNPLLVFEVAHAGHVDGLMLPYLILAFWARHRERYGLLGLSLGAATLIKLFPILLLPALLPLPRALSWAGARPARRTLAAFAGIIAIGYALYLYGGASPLGFLPVYFGENFNMGLAGAIWAIARALGLSEAWLASLLTFGGMAVLAILFTLRPAADGRQALGRCVWLIAWFTLFTQNLFPWYLLWLLPLLAIFVEPGPVLGLRLAPSMAWLVFTGTSALSYLFFIRWRTVPWGQVAEFAPLYALLLASFGAWLWARMPRSAPGRLLQAVKPSPESSV